jgi:hypothetical protein
MPNWCMNELNVCGPSDKVGEFVHDAVGKDTVLSFASVVPIPEWAEQEDWHLAHCFLWGTKWNAIEPCIEYEEEYNGNREITYEFYTAWGPPCEFVMRAARKYPDLTFRLKWNEPLMDLVGRMRADNGEVKEFRELQNKPFDPITTWLLLGIGIDGTIAKPNIREFFAKLDPLVAAVPLAEQPPIKNSAATLAV